MPNKTEINYKYNGREVKPYQVLTGEGLLYYYKIDKLQRIEQISNGNKITKYTYNVHSFITTMTNSLGHESRYYYDKLCNLIQYNSPVVEDLLS